MASDFDTAIAAELATLAARLDQVRPSNIGFPGATDIDYSPLADILSRELLNNVGDPYIDGSAANHTKPIERQVITFFADLLRAPADNHWGYVTSGGTESNLCGLHLARRLHPGAVVYHSKAAHPSITKAIDILAMPSVTIPTDPGGEIDYDHLATQIRGRRNRPAIVVANIGTTMTEAVDDVRRITRILGLLAVRDRFVHADAALAGIPLALLEPADRPGFDLADGADSIAVSGHKFLGTPTPCGVVIIKTRHHSRTRSVTYTGSPDTTISGSRNGHAPLLLWYAIRRHGLDGLRDRAEQCRDLAAHAHQRLTDMPWPALRHRHAFTVALQTPPPNITQHWSRQWVLASDGAWSHLVCMPGVSREQIDDFLADLQTATVTAAMPRQPARGMT